MGQMLLAIDDLQEPGAVEEAVGAAAASAAAAAIYADEASTAASKRLHDDRDDMHNSRKKGRGQGEAQGGLQQQ